MCVCNMLYIKGFSDKQVGQQGAERLLVSTGKFGGGNSIPFQGVNCKALLPQNGPFNI